MNNSEIEKLDRELFDLSTLLRAVPYTDEDDTTYRGATWFHVSATRLIESGVEIEPVIVQSLLRQTKVYIDKIIDNYF